MSNSVVKVTDDALNDSLLLLVGEDGTVSPDKETVETYLNSKSGPTDIQIMHINKSDAKGVDVSIDNVTYVPESEVKQVSDAPIKERDLEEVLRNIRLDHDYIALAQPKPEEIDDDELAKTLSILDGNNDVPEDAKIKAVAETIVKTLQPSILTKVQTNKLVSKVVKPPALVPVVKTVSTPAVQQKPIQVVVVSKNSTAPTENQTTTTIKTLTPVTKPKQKILNSQVLQKLTIKQKPVKLKPKVIPVQEDIDDIEEEDDDDIDFDVAEDDENDSDYELEEKTPKTPRRTSRRLKSESKVTPPAKPKSEQPAKPIEKPTPIPEPIITTTPPQTDTKVTPPEKKPVKKEKKPPKPIPDDFALFSTPHIIRRVSGKEPPSSGSDTSSPTKPAKITQENRSKSANETSPLSSKSQRLSIDSKLLDNKDKQTVSACVKLKETKSKRVSLDEKPKIIIDTLKKCKTSSDVNDSLGDILSATDEALSRESQSLDQSAISLDTSGLDLDPTILDNINNDLIPEDILYQVAQSLVSNTEIQNAIEKGLNEGVLDPTMPPTMDMNNSISDSQENNDIQVKYASSDSSQKSGTQIVRADGRVVLIPPIERPTTRSRNKKKEDEKPVIKSTHKPLDDEHVSGNELDSSNEEESEDDPNKLWCICNQPHNNRFMICCDTCEEWYHGKCVNITKTMGQQMEAEGKEWICRFCKDPALRRPSAAARRIRKASRDSSGSNKKKSVETASVPCIVCHKSSRKNSIYCSEECIWQHAEGIGTTVVYERATGKMLSGSKAPNAANIDDWLKQHPGYEVVKSGRNVVTSKPTQNLTQSKLKLVKSPGSGVSLALQKKGVNIGIMKHSPKTTTQQAQQPQQKTPPTPTLKFVSKQVNTKEPKTKLIQAQPLPSTPAKSTAPATTPSPKQTKPAAITVTRKSSTGSINQTPTTPKDKPVPVKTPKSRQAEQQAALTPQAKQPENIRENVQKWLWEQLTNRLKMVDDLKLTEEEVKNISTEIESELFKCFGDTGQKYRNKYRSLMFNIKDVKNQTLWRRICEKTINPYALVRLSPDDLASQELALWREREAKHQLDMIKKSELELLNCNRQYVLKTHKGEQVLEDNRPTDHSDNTEVIKSLTEGSTLEGELKVDSSKKSGSTSSTSSKHNSSHKDRDKKSSKEKSDGKEHRSHRSSSKDRDRSRKRSRSREHGTKHNSTDKKRSRSRDKHRKSTHKSSRYKKEIHISTTEKLDKKSKEILEQLVDNKIVPPLEDRLWKHVPQDDIPPPVAESDSDHEPTSTVTIPTPPRNSEPDDFPVPPIKKEEEDRNTNSSSSSSVSNTIVSASSRHQGAELWRGTISMVDVAQIAITAHELSGDCTGLGNDLTSSLDIVGRISQDTVWDYINKMKCSSTKTISLVRLKATNNEEKMPYLALYSYLNSRDRLGVVKSTNKAIKDFYIFPLTAQKPIPQALLPINRPGFEESRPAMLLGIIVRDKRKRLSTDISSIIPAKRSKIVTPPPVVPTAVPPRSYTPPPIKDPRLNKLPLPPTVSTVKDDDEEPYSPEDSDPDSNSTPLDVPTAAVDIFDSNVAPPTYQPQPSIIPGLDDTPVLPISTIEMQRQMEELNKQIELKNSEINNISQNIASASTELGSSALANIALPSNLQQILDSIKTVKPTNETKIKPEPVPPPLTEDPNTTDLTIPLIIPKTFSRPLLSTQPKILPPTDTIPLNLPMKPKIKPSSVNSPLRILEKDNKPTNSVLSSLSEEDLIRKAEEMLSETTPKEDNKRKLKEVIPVPPPLPNSNKRPKNEVELPPVPGLD